MAVTQTLTTSLVGTTMTITLVVTNGGASSTSPVGVYFPNPTGTWSTSASTTGAATGYTAGPTASAINDAAIVMPASSTVTYVKTGTLSSGTYVGVVPVVTDPGRTAQAATYSATVTPNADTTSVLNIAALTGSLTLATPSGTPFDGQQLLVRFVQDGTGGRVVTHSAGYVFDSVTPAVGDPVAASAVWERLYRYETSTTKWRCVGIWGGLSYTTTTAYAATVTPNCDTTDLLNIGALTGNLTLAAPTGTPVDGQKLQVVFLQDGTGGRTITYNAAYAFGTDVTAAMDPTTASAKWSRMFQWHATDSKWRATAIVRGF